MEPTFNLAGRPESAGNSREMRKLHTLPPGNVVIFFEFGKLKRWHSVC